MIPGWLDEMEGEVLACLSARGSMSVPELARALRVSESCAASYVVLLAAAQRLVIERVAAPPEARAASRTPWAA